MKMKGINIVTQVIIYGMALLGTILCFAAMQTDAKVDPVTQQISTDATSVSNSITFTFVLLWVSGIVIVLGTILALLTNVKKFIPSLIGLAVFGVFLLIAMAFIYVEKDGPITDLPLATENVIWWTDFGLRATYVMSVVAVLAIVGGNILKVLRYFQK
jgi:hypothetical protein